MPTQAVAPPRTRVLIVEDDPHSRTYLGAAIRLEDDLALQGTFGLMQQARDWLTEHRVDVLLVDIGLPDGSGIELISHCHRTHPDCGILVISMFGDEANILESIRAGAAGYILKDSKPIDIVEAIRTLRSGGSPMSPLIARKVLAQLRDSSAVPARGNRGGDGTDISLTRREADTLNLIARGYTYAEIAGLLEVTVSTIQTHIKSIYGKLEVHSRGEAVFEAHKLGLLDRDLTRT
jgi:DNA-binding NarL/FixJ family response regulator